MEGVKAFHRRDYQKAADIFKKKAQVRDKDYALHNLALLSATLYAGEYEAAEKAALNANQVMWGYGGKGKGTASLISAEAIKVFKGEPFEKSMASIYAGIIYYNRGEYDNARAAFNKAAMAVKMKEAKHSQDFALPFLLQAKVFLKLGQNDNARIALKKAKKRRANNPYLTLEHLRQSNALFLVELGTAPKKTRTGPGKSLVKWVRPKYPEQRAVLYVDDQKVGSTALIGDLTYQAQTKGWTGKDTVQVSKGVARDAATVTTVIAANEAAKGNKTAGWVALGAGLFALANQSQADIRQWELLPDLVHLSMTHLTPGMHMFRLSFLGKGGHPIRGYDQVWYHMPFEKKDDKIYLFRSGPVNGPLGQTNLTKGKTK